MTRSSRWNEVTDTKDRLEKAIIALERVIQINGAPPRREAKFTEKERLLREVAFRKSEYVVKVDQFNHDFPGPGAPLRKDVNLLSRTTPFDEGYLNEVPIDNGRELPEMAEPGKELKSKDIKDKHGNRRSPLDAETARLLTQDAFKKFHSHEIDELIKQGEPLDEEFMNGFLQSERNLAIISKRSPAADAHEVKAINRAIWTEFLTLYQQRSDDLLTQELNYRFFGRVRPLLPNGPLPIAFMDPNVQLTLAGFHGGAGPVMLTALGLPNAAPNLPTFAQFKAAIIALQPNTPQWDNFWNTVPAGDRNELQAIVKSYQSAVIDNTNLLAEAKAWKSSLDTKATPYNNSISGYDHILDHNTAMSGITSESTISIAPSVTALALAEETAKRGPIDPDSLGAAAYAAILAGTKHGTDNHVKLARAQEVSESVKRAARTVEAKYDEKARLLASPAAAAAAVSNTVFANGNILKNIPQNPPNPRPIIDVLNLIANSARDAVLSLEAPGHRPTQRLGNMVRWTVIDAVQSAARALKGRLNNPNPDTAKAALSLIAGAGAIAAAVNVAARKKGVTPAQSRNLGLQAAERFINNNGTIQEADIRALAAAAGLNDDVIKALSQAARTASLTNEGAAAANDVRMNAQQRVEQEATRLNIPQGLAKDIAHKIALEHFNYGSIDDVRARTCIDRALTHINRARQAVHRIAGQHFGLTPDDQRGVSWYTFPYPHSLAFKLPSVIENKIRDNLIAHIAHIDRVGAGSVMNDEILAIINQAETEHRTASGLGAGDEPLPLTAAVKNHISGLLIQNVLAPPVPGAAIIGLNDLVLPDDSRVALIQHIRTTYEHTNSEAIGAGVAEISHNQGIGNDVTTEFKAGRSAQEIVTSTAKKLSTDPIKSVAVAALISDGDPRPHQPGDVISTGYKIGQPAGMMTEATTLAAAAKNTALEVGLPPAVADDIVQRIVDDYMDYPVNRLRIYTAINAACLLANPVVGLTQENKTKIAENVLAAYAISCGQEAGKAAVITHAQADQVKVKAVASVSAALGIYYGLTAPLAAQLGAGLAALYVQAAQAGQPLTDKAIRDFITGHLQISEGFPSDPVDDLTLNAISKAVRAVSTIVSEDVTSATTAAAKAFPTNENLRNSYCASIVATLCAGKKPVDIANSVAVAKAGVLAYKSKAEKFGSPAAAAARAAAALLEGNPRRVNVLLNVLNAAPRVLAAQQIAAAAAQAISDVDDPTGANPPLVQDTRQAVRTSVQMVALEASRQPGATLSSISRAVSTAAAIAAALVKAGCARDDAQGIAIAACAPDIMAKGIGAVLNKIRNEIASRDIVLPPRHQENVDNVLKAASSGFGIGAGIVAGDVSRLAANLAIDGAAAVQAIDGGVDAFIGVATMAAVTQPIRDAIRNSVIQYFLLGGGGVPDAIVQQIAARACLAADNAIVEASNIVGASLNSIADSAAVAAAVAAVAIQIGIAAVDANRIALAAARVASGGEDAIAIAINTALAGPPAINATPETVALLRQAAGAALNAQREMRAPRANQPKVVKSIVMSDSVKSTASVLDVSDEKAEEIRQVTKDSLNNNETSLEASSRASSLLSGGNGLAVAAVGAFVADPGLTDSEKAQQVSQASGVSQVRTNQRVLSSRPGHLDKSIHDRAALEQYTADEEAATAEVMKKERAKLMKMMPSLPHLQTFKRSKVLDIETFDAKSALKWSIKSSEGRPELIGSIFSLFNRAAKELSECVDADGKSFLTRSALEAVIKDLKKNKFFDVSSDVTIIDRPPKGITIDFGCSSDFQINRLLKAWAERCKIDHAATKLANPSPSPMRLGNPG